MITAAQLHAAAKAQMPALFHVRNTAEGLDEARTNALGSVARGFIAAGFAVEGFEPDEVVGQ